MFTVIFKMCDSSSDTQHYSCPCGEKFHHKETFLAHRWKHIAWMENVFPCPACWTLLESEQDRTRHFENSKGCREAVPATPPNVSRSDTFCCLTNYINTSIISFCHGSNADRRQVVVSHVWWFCPCASCNFWQLLFLEWVFSLLSRRF